MKIKTTLAAAILLLIPGIAAAQCMGDHSMTDATMSCADGAQFDNETQTCVPTVTG